MGEEEGTAVVNFSMVTYLMCWVFGVGALISWNSMLNALDYYSTIFLDYHPSRVVTLVYQPFAVVTAGILVYYEARLNTRLRVLFGFSLYFIAALVVPILDLATNGRGGLGAFLGICIVSCAFGLASAFVEGGVMGELSCIDPRCIQPFSAGLGASGAVTSVLRLVTKAALLDTKDGLRKSAIVFFFISASIELLCLILYCYAFPRLEIVNNSKENTDEEQAKHETPATLSAKQLLIENSDYAFDIFATFVLSQSILFGFLAEDTGNHSLKTWYVIVLIALCNFGDVIGRYLPLIKMIKLESRKGLMSAVLLRSLFIPAFYVTANYGDEGWMLLLCVFLGITNGYLTVCVLTSAPNGYKAAEKKALGSILVFFLLGGIFAGIAIDWLWLIRKGW